MQVTDYSTFKAEQLDLIKIRGVTQFEEIKNEVQNILNDIKQNGDPAVIKYIKKFDNAQINTTELKVLTSEIKEAYSQIDSQIHTAIKEIIRNISLFHEAQKRDLWYIDSREGVKVGQIMRPIQRVGVYVPGGKALYPSTVLMTVVPAKIAGVQEIILCTPPQPDGTINPIILVAASEAGADAIYKVGGVQAVGAMAYGTKTIPQVNKIVGPGNRFVNTAKILVSNIVGIDLPAGPSEVLIFADETSDPNFIAIDIISQAEHDENAFCFLIASSKILINQVKMALERLISGQPRKSIIEKALKNNCYIIFVDTVQQAIELINEIAPEHLELQIEDVNSILSQINNAGAIFLGKYSPVPVGDYAAGTNHVLPTGGAAKIFSGLSLASFMKYIDITKCTSEGLQTLSPWIQTLAKIEGLNAHAQAIQMRLEK